MLCVRLYAILAAFCAMLEGCGMNTRKEFIRDGFGLAAIISAQTAPAILVRSMAAARNGIGVRARTVPPPAVDYWGLCFTALEDGSTVGVQRHEATSASYPCPDLSLRISYEGITWIPYLVGTMIGLRNGETVCFSAGDGGNERTSATGRSGFGYNYFSGTGVLAASGSLDSILLNSNQITTALPNYCYRNLFSRMTALISSPLIVAPAGSSSYISLFNQCVNLESITCMFDSWVSGATNGWVNGVKDTGTFYCKSVLGTDATIQRGISNCPQGWTVVNIG